MKGEIVVLIVQVSLDRQPRESVRVFIYSSDFIEGLTIVLVTTWHALEVLHRLSCSDGKFRCLSDKY